MRELVKARAFQVLPLSGLRALGVPGLGVFRALGNSGAQGKIRGFEGLGVCRSVVLFVSRLQVLVFLSSFLVSLLLFLSLQLFVVRLILIITAFCGLFLLLVFLLRALGRGLGGRKSFEKIRGTLF